MTQIWKSVFSLQIQHSFVLTVLQFSVLDSKVNFCFRKNISCGHFVDLLASMGEEKPKLAVILGAGAHRGIQELDPHS